MVSPGLTFPQPMLEIVHALFQSVPLFEPDAAGRTYQLAACAPIRQKNEADAVANSLIISVFVAALRSTCSFDDTFFAINMPNKPTSAQPGALNRRQQKYKAQTSKRPVQTQAP